jgi:hypothetical protein
MELPGAEYLYNLSILAVTFATVSALVTVVRQISGGSLTKVDIHLLTTFLSAGFAISIAAILPSLVNLFGLTLQVVWPVVSGMAAVLFAVLIARIQRERRMFAAMGLAPVSIVAFGGLWISVVILVINAAPTPIQGIAPYAAAITLSLATVMWSFVHRIASLSRGDGRGDWDLSRG